MDIRASEYVSLLDWVDAKPRTNDYAYDGIFPSWPLVTQSVWPHQKSGWFWNQPFDLDKSLKVFA